MTSTLNIEWGVEVFQPLRGGNPTVTYKGRIRMTKEEDNTRRVIEEHSAQLRRIDDEQPGDILASYRFTPSFEMKLIGPGGAASFIITFGTNSEGDNDMMPEHLRNLLVGFLQKTTFA